MPNQKDNFFKSMFFSGFSEFSETPNRQLDPLKFSKITKNFVILNIEIAKG
jgi:hypothetical protein